ncbi:MAG: glycosyltransferase family protein [Magnetococcales bacterium]|nr:glycosyltransferase family protein [Magnetococcales bacterium]
MRCVAIIQARMGSSRLPGKVLKTLGGRTALHSVITRVQQASELDDVVLATTDKPEDDPTAVEANKHGAMVFRGSEQDVLSRYLGASIMAKADVVIRITADCPLYDGPLLDRMLKLYKERVNRGENIDFFSNTLTRTFPIGLDTEIFPAKHLVTADQEAKTSYQREHVTPFIYQNPDRYTLLNHVESPDLSHHRWTLDTAEDYKFFQAVFSSFDNEPKRMTTGAIVDFLKERPDIMAINAHVQQKP